MNTISIQNSAKLQSLINDFLHENFPKECRQIDRGIIAPDTLLTTDRVAFEMMKAACAVLDRYLDKSPQLPKKLFVQNCGCDGSVVVVATSQEEAHKFVQNNNPPDWYEKDTEFDEYNIDQNPVVVNFAGGF